MTGVISDRRAIRRLAFDDRHIVHAHPAGARCLGVGGGGFLYERVNLVGGDVVARQ